jgi:hypothetical protein
LTIGNPTKLPACGNDHAEDWMNPSRTVDYEVACGVIGQLIGQQVELIASEEEKAIPNRSLIEAAGRERRALIEARDALKPEDFDAIRHAIETYGPRARQIVASRKA